MPDQHAQDVDNTRSTRSAATTARPRRLPLLAAIAGLAMAGTAVAGNSVVIPAGTAAPQPLAYPEDPVLALHPEAALISATPAQRGDADNLLQRLRLGFAMPDDGLHPRVESHLRWLYGKQAYIDRVLDRAARNMYLAVSEAERRGLPTELALLPIIESAYDPMALSRSQAAGLWQFIPDTGRLYGLRQNSWFDARRDPIESTRAAYNYLSELYATFGDWALVLASYNAGPGTVSRAMKRNAAAGLPTDYWSLNLPAETMAYVPRFLAVVSLFKRPSEFGVSLPSLPNRPYFRTVSTQGPLTLADIAGATGVDTDLLRLLNPGMRRDRMDPAGPNQVHVPVTLDMSRENALAQLLPGSVPVLVADAGGTPSAVTAPVVSLPAGTSSSSATAVALPVAVRQVSAEGGHHRVQARETWYSIARAYDIHPGQLSAYNQSSLGTPLDIGQDVRIPGGMTAATRPALAATGIIPAAQVISIGDSDRRVELRRKVLPGETLESLRRQYQVTLAELRAWNGNLQQLKAGQTVILRVLPDMLQVKAL